MAYSPRVLEETVMTLSQAARKLPRLKGDKPVSPETLVRWSEKGLRGFKLDTAKMGGTTVTSQEALQRFFRQTNGDVAGPVVPTPMENSEIKRRLDELDI